MNAQLGPPTIHRSEAELPFVQAGEGNTLQVLQVDLAQGIWIVRNKFDPGTVIQTHKHTGHVYAVTLSGSWHYLESPEAVNRAGSYLYEPAGSVHTLNVPETNTEPTDVWFAVHGANLNLDANGQVELVVDAPFMLEIYRAFCKEQHGLEDPPVVVIEPPPGDAA